MNIVKYTLLLALLIQVTTGNSQSVSRNIIKSDSVLKEVKNGSYDVVYRFKSLSETKDTTVYKAIVSFQKVFDADTIKYTRYKFSINKSWSAIYDGVNLLVIDMDSTATRYNVLKNERDAYLSGNGATELLYRYFF